MNKLIRKSLKTLFVAMMAIVATSCFMVEGGEESTGKVVINEVNADAKYIELYNLSGVAVDLGGWTIRKNNEGPIADMEGTGSFVIAEGTILPGKGYALLNCKGANNEHQGVALGTSSSGVSGKKSLLLELINNEGERVDYFVNSGNEHPAAVDVWDGAVEHTFDIAARIPDGGGWWVVDTATPAAKNEGEEIAQFVNIDVDFEKEPEEDNKDNESGDEGKDEEGKDDDEEGKEDEALAEYPDMEDSIVKFLRSKLGENPDEKDKKRAIDAALRRGHNYSQIRRAMNSLDLDQEDFLEEY